MARGPALMYGELSFPIHRVRTTIGRRNVSAGVAPIIDLAPLDRDRVVSRSHAEIQYREGKLFLCELGARNGLFVNGERLGAKAEHLLRDSDSVAFGGVALTFRAEADWPDGLVAEWAPPVEPAGFDAPADVTIAASGTLSGQLHQSVERGELMLHYQPKIELASEKLEAVECLIRWNHPSGRLVPPDSFLPLAENTGYIKAITQWVFEAALRQCALWQAVGLHLHVAVNISTRDLEDDRLAERLAALMGTIGVDPTDVVVEVTETGVMSNPQRAIENLARLRATRVKVSIDDFGIGQSSLAYLRQVPADELKIDKSFAMQPDPHNLKIIATAIRIGHDLGMRVVAEGVESTETLRTLRDLGCDAGQGFFIGRPMTAEALIQHPLALQIRPQRDETTMPGTDSPFSRSHLHR